MGYFRRSKILLIDYGALTAVISRNRCFISFTMTFASINRVYFGLCAIVSLALFPFMLPLRGKGSASLWIGIVGLVLSICFLVLAIGFIRARKAYFSGALQ